MVLFMRILSVLPFLVKSNLKLIIAKSMFFTNAEAESYQF